MKKAFLQMHIAVFLAGFTAVLGKLILLNEGLLVWYRLLITVTVLAGILFFQKELKWFRLKDVLQMGGVGGIIAFHWVCFYGSVKYGNISVALVCLSAAGFFSALLEPLIVRRRVQFTELFLGLLAILGIYIIFDFYPELKLGIIYGLLSSASSAVFPIFNKRLLQRFSPRTLTFYELAGGLVILSIALPFYLHETVAVYYWPTATDAFWLVVLAVVCTVVAFDLQLQALKKISAFTVNLLYNLEPLYGIILAFSFFGEGKMFHREFYYGVALILFAVCFQMWRVIRGARRAAAQR